jgi:CheY-like chemotaxis protein
MERFVLALFFATLKRIASLNDQIEVFDVGNMLLSQDLPKLLLADDDESSLKAFALFFEIEGFDVQIARDGWEAIELYDRWRPDLALLDIDMPFINGYGVARRMREDTRAPPVLLIAITGRGDSPPEREASLSAGFDHHIAKPAQLPYILELANDHLEKYFS